MMNTTPRIVIGTTESEETEILIRDQSRRKAVSDQRSNPVMPGKAGIRVAGLCVSGLTIWTLIQVASRREPTSDKSGAPPLPSSRK